MKVNDELYVLELPLNFGGATMMMCLSLIVDPDHGLTLVDTGVPGQEGLIEEALIAEGFSLAELKQIVLTHQDMDHVGSLSQLKQLTGANLVAYVDEVPYIDGRLVSPKRPSAERLAQMPEFAALLNSLKRTEIDEPVNDGDTLSKSGNAKVIATPGHTHGHMSLYLPKSKTLITGDAMVSENGRLFGPMAAATPNMAQAMESVKKFLEYDIETIVCYHGGLVTDDANGQVSRVAG